LYAHVQLGGPMSLVRLLKEKQDLWVIF
jgi:hypothetical protein